MSQRERLDFEDEEARSARLGNLFSSISQPPTEGTEAPPFPLPPSRPHAVPESDVLARARAFLPLLAASNADIFARAAADPGSVSIENENSGSGDVVAMDVGLGVFDVKGEVKGDMGPVVEREGRVWEEANEESESGEESESESDSGTESETEGGSDASEDKPDAQNAQPKVVEL